MALYQSHRRTGPAAQEKSSCFQELLEATAAGLFPSEARIERMLNRLERRS